MMLVKMLLRCVDGVGMLLLSSINSVETMLARDVDDVGKCCLDT